MKILIHEQFAAELAAALSARLGAASPGLTTFGDGEAAAEVAARITGCDVLVWGEFLATWRDRDGRGPRLVHVTGAGVDGIHFASLPPGCVVCNVYGHERGVAEQAFMHMLALQKGLLRSHAALRQGDWRLEAEPYIFELRGRNLLILGLGHIGAELVRWGQFLEMKVTALTRSPSRERANATGLDSAGSLDDLGKHLGDADFVVVAIPATPDTIDLIGAAEIERMKRTAFVVNVGRAAVINEAALYEALRTRRIAGAGLDVWYQYPATLKEKKHPSRFPLHELDNVVMTPHKPTAETMAYRWGKIAENIDRFARGEPLENVVRVVPAAANAPTQP